MKLSYRTIAISFLLLVFSFANAVVAEAWTGVCGDGDSSCFSQLYIGLTGGEADWNLASDAQLTAIDENDTSFGALFGYRINKWVGFEVAGNYFGEPDYVEIKDVKVLDYGVGVNLYLPLGSVIDDSNFDFISVFAKGGMHFWYFEANDSTLAIDYDDNGADLFYGLGLNIDLNKHLALRAEHNVYEMKIDTSETNIDTNSLTAILKF